MNNTATQPGNLRMFAISALVMGAIGGLLCWWVPFGIVLSIAGMVVSFITGIAARSHSSTLRLSVAGFLVSLACLGLDIAIYALGWQFITFGGRG